MASLIDELYPEDTHARRMWLKYDEIGADTPLDERERIISEMMAMQEEDEKEKGRDAVHDSSVFWGVIAGELRDLARLDEAEKCFRRQIDAIMESGPGDDPLLRATSLRAMSGLLGVMGQNLEKTDEAFLDEIREIWNTARMLLDEGWDDGALIDLDDLYWLPRRKALFEAGLSTALARGDEEASLSLSHEFISSDAEIPEGDDWYDIYSDILDMAILEMRLAEGQGKMDELLDGIHWLDDNSRALMEHTSDIEYEHVPYLVYFYTLGGSFWRKAGNDEKTNELWTNGLEMVKELYREDNELTFEGLKTHIGLFRAISDSHREEGRHEESFETELEIRKLLSSIKPHIADSDIIGERVSNGMYLGSYSEDMERWEDMLSYWLDALENLLDAEPGESWAANVTKVLSDHWKSKDRSALSSEGKDELEKLIMKAEEKFF